MTRKNRSAQLVSDRREHLHAAYFHVVNNWAVGADEVALHLHESGIAASAEEAAKLAKSLLGSLSRKNLVESIHVNDDKTLTWQSSYDIENDPEATERAEADFNLVFPQKVAQAPAKKGGATGAKYTDSQISAGLKARREGKSNKQVAAAAGVKSPSYFAKTLKGIEANHEAARKRSPNRKPAAKKAKRNMKNSPVKIGARKDDGPQGLKNLLP